MKPEADATTKSWVTAVPCPWCLAFARDLPCASRHKVMCWGSDSPLSSGAGCCRPGRVCGCPNICGQMLCRISHRNEERRWHSSGRPHSAEAVGSLVTVTHRAGSIAGVPQGLLVGAWGACLLSLLCPAGILLAAKKRRLKQELLKGFF